MENNQNQGQILPARGLMWPWGGLQSWLQLFLFANATYLLELAALVLVAALTLSQNFWLVC